MQADHGLRVRGGDEHPPGPAAGPQAWQDARVSQVIEYQQPPLVGLPQPVDKARRDRLGVTRQLRSGNNPCRLDVAGQRCCRTACVDPYQQVHRPGTPLRLREERGQLGLAAATQPVLRRARAWAARPGRQRDRGAPIECHDEVGRSLRPGTEPVRQWRYSTSSDRPLCGGLQRACCRGRRPAVHARQVHLHQGTASGTVKGRNLQQYG